MTIIEKIAKVAHEANRAWCEGHGDFSQPRWETVPGWQRQAAISSVLAHIQARDEGRMLPDSAEHDRWMQEKHDAGWTWGPEKDPDQKRHPCLVPFSDLPLHQQLKDALIAAVVRSLMRAADEAMSTAGYGTPGD